MLHPHVATAIEVEDEVHRVLREIEESILGVGPDTGHLTWAGMDPVVELTQIVLVPCTSRMFTLIR